MLSTFSNLRTKENLSVDVKSLVKLGLGDGSVDKVLAVQTKDVSLDPSAQAKAGCDTVCL